MYLNTVLSRFERLPPWQNIFDFSIFYQKVNEIHFWNQQYKTFLWNTNLTLSARCLKNQPMDSGQGTEAPSVKTCTESNIWNVLFHTISKKKLLVFSLLRGKALCLRNLTCKQGCFFVFFCPNSEMLLDTVLFRFERLPPWQNILDCSITYQHVNENHFWNQRYKTFLLYTQSQF